MAAVRGRFDITNATEIGLALAQAALDREHLVVSLNACSYIDVDGVAQLLLLRRRLGGYVVVSEPRRVFEITNIQKIIRIEPSVEDAIRWIKTVHSEAR